MVAIIAGATIHGRIQKIPSGGGGGPGVYVFFSHQYISQRALGTFQWGPIASQLGIHNSISKDTFNHLWLSRGGGVRTPVLPSGSAHHAISDILTWTWIIYNQWRLSFYQWYALDMFIIMDQWMAKPRKWCAFSKDSAKTLISLSIWQVQSVITVYMKKTNDL